MSVYDIVTEKILERIEDCKKNNKKLFWVRPYTGGCPYPASYMSQMPYHGINSILLEPGEYISFKAIQDYRKSQPENAEIYVKKGAKKVPIFYFGKYEKKDEHGNPILDEYGEQEKGSFLRYYSVFNIEDVHGVHSHYPAKKVIKTTNKITKALDKYIATFAKNTKLTIDIVEDGARCYYSSSEHMIRVPERVGFTSTYAYYSAVLHEIIHSTAKFTNRHIVSKYDSDAYSREELVAQIGAQMLLEYFQIAFDDNEFENDVAYMDGWLKKFNDNKTEIVKAASQAQYAVNYFIENCGVIKKEKVNKAS